jgi:ABC-type glycerol-3-phosphate transport system permease component
MIMVSLKSEVELFSNPFGFFPKEWNPIGYITNIKDSRVFNWMKNSVIVSGLAVLISTGASSLAAFALSRFRFKFNKFVLASSVATQMIVPAAIIAPIYLMLNTMRLIDNFAGLAVVEAAFQLGFTMSVLKSFFDNVPIQLDEAAKLEGCSEFKIFRTIVLPLSTPAVVSVLLISFFDVYNEFLYSSTLITDTKKWLGPAGIASNTSRVGVNWTVTLSQTVLFSIIPLVLYFALQRYIIRGLTTGAVKG